MENIKRIENNKIKSEMNFNRDRIRKLKRINLSSFYIEGVNGYVNWRMKYILFNSCKVTFLYHVIKTEIPNILIEYMTIISHFENNVKSKLFKKTDIHYICF